MKRFVFPALLSLLVLTPLGARAEGSVASELAATFEQDSPVERIFLELAGNTTGFTDEEEWALAEAIHRAAELEGVDPYLVLAVITVESSLKKGQRSSVGALGLMQVRPSTGRAFAERAGVRWRGRRTLLTPEENIRIGTAYLAHLLRRFKGNTTLALTAYCHGPTRVRRLLRDHGHLDAERLRYSRKVRAQWRRYKKGGAQAQPVT